MARRSVRRARVADTVAEMLREAGFSISHERRVHFPRFDMFAERVERDGKKVYAIEIKVNVAPATVLKLAEIASGLSSDEGINELWIVANDFSREARALAETRLKVRAFTPVELRRALGLSAPSLARRSKVGQTNIGKAALLNAAQITLAASAMLLLLDERLESLRRERPNSGEAIAARDDLLSGYGRLKADLITLRTATTEFKEGKIKESSLIKSSKRFAEGVQSWWTKSHNLICDRAFEMSLFLSAVGICTMAGAGGNVAVVVSAALVGGKPVANVLKGFGKRLFKGD